MSLPSGHLIDETLKNVSLSRFSCHGTDSAVGWEAGEIFKLTLLLTTLATHGLTSFWRATTVCKPHHRCKKEGSNVGQAQPPGVFTAPSYLILRGPERKEKAIVRSSLQMKSLRPRELR